MYIISSTSRKTFLYNGSNLKYRSIAEEQQKSEVQINAKRGRILDRNTNELVISVDVYQINLDLKTIKQTLTDNTITSDELANKLSSILRQDLIKIVTEGVGQNAFVQGLDIAGKAGTAQVADSATGRYVPGKYMPSFVGMAPARNTKITLWVSVDEPEGSNYYAGEVSAPIARDLFKQIFDYITIKGEENVLGK